MEKLSGGGKVGSVSQEKKYSPFYILKISGRNLVEYFIFLNCKISESLSLICLKKKKSIAWAGGEKI